MSTVMKANNPDSDEFRVVTDRNITNVPDNCTEQHADSLNMDIIIARHHLQTVEEDDCYCSHYIAARITNIVLHEF